MNLTAETENGRVGSAASRRNGGYFSGLKNPGSARIQVGKAIEVHSEVRTRFGRMHASAMAGERATSRFTDQALCNAARKVSCATSAGVPEPSMICQPLAAAISRYASRAESK